MDREQLMDQIDFVQARIEETEKLVINCDPKEKGYRELLINYNMYVDRYDKMIDMLEHIDDEKLEREKLKLESEKNEIEKQRVALEENKMKINEELEKRRLELEADKMKAEEQIETDKNNLHEEEIRLDREKFAQEVEAQIRREKAERLDKAIDTGVKIAVPLIAIGGAVTIAKLAYANDADLKLCNGHVWGGVKDVLKIAMMKLV